MMGETSTASGLEMVEKEMNNAKPESGFFDFLTFAIGNRKLAFPLANVERVIRMTSLVPVPEAPQWVSGLLNLHGHVIPVIDLRERLGLSGQRVHPDHRILVVHSNDQTLGVVAERVEDVTPVSKDRVEHPPGTLRKSKLLRAVIQKDGAVYLVLEANAIDTGALIEFEEDAKEDAGVSECFIDR